MTRAGKASISSRSEHGVHTVWSVIGFYAETLIFMLAGIFFGIEMTVDIWVANWWKSIVLYLFLILIRLVLLLITFKPMCWMGYNH